jgi:hypothetical protein
LFLYNITSYDYAENPLLFLQKNPQEKTIGKNTNSVETEGTNETFLFQFTIHTGLDYEITPL